MSTFIFPGNDQPLGYQQITSLSSATNLTVPNNASRALIICESQAVRWSDFSTPTASVGMPLAIGVYMLYTGGFSGLKAIKFIEQTPSATINVAYYA